MIDEILINPSVSQGELARQFGFTEAWMSIIINSDAFQEKLAQRKGELIDPKIQASINDRLDAIAKTAMDKIIARLDNPAANIKNIELVAMAKLGVGDRNNRPVAPPTTNLYVVALPPPAENSSQWLAGRNTPQGLPLIIENATRG